MTDTSVDASGPPAQEVELIAKWGSIWLENRGNGHAAVSMVLSGERKTVALVEYGDRIATSDVRWNKTGTLALERHKRETWNSRFYSRIGQWLQDRAS